MLCYIITMAISYCLTFFLTPRYPSFIGRTLLAAIDHNAHNFRPNLCSNTGKMLFKRQYSKRAKGWHVQAVRSKKDFKYINPLLKKIFKRRRDSNEPVTAQPARSPKDPKLISPTICMTKTPPSTEELVQQRLSRFVEK